MTHIIGTPPRPPRGATFADVPARKGRLSLFAASSGVAYIRTGRNEAIRCDSGGLAYLNDNEPVTLLTVQPVDPEPDPSVTTYGELEPGIRGAYAFPGRSDVWIPADHGKPPVRLRDGLVANGEPLCPVRRVDASVVIHEGPGTQVRVNPEHGEIEVMTFDGWRPVGTLLRAIVQQGAALLAQEAASPESEPEPAEDRSKPAPGWVVEDSVLSREVPPGRARVFHRCASRTDAIRLSCIRHDDEQKDGDS